MCSYCDAVDGKPHASNCPLRTVKLVGFVEVPSTFWEDQADLAALIDEALV
jgi:hypothetical protein